MFFRKKPLRKFTVPAEHIPELCRLLDAHYAAPNNTDHVSHYNLWHFVESLFPDVKSDHKWKINASNATQITICEV